MPFKEAKTGDEQRNERGRMLPLNGEEYRICDVCGKVMWEGFLIYGWEHYCSEECLHTEYTKEEYAKLYDEDDGFWTHWY